MMLMQKRRMDQGPPPQAGGRPDCLEAKEPKPTASLGHRGGIYPRWARPGRGCPQPARVR
jgi:hypothetical protein